MYHPGPVESLSMYPHKRLRYRQQRKVGIHPMQREVFPVYKNEKASI